MVSNHKILLGASMAIILLIGVSVASVKAKDDQANGSRKKDLLQIIDGAIRSLRFGKDPSGNLGRAQKQYLKLGGEDNDDIDNLFDNIKDQWKKEGKKKKKEIEKNIRKLRSKVKKELNINLPFYFEHSIFVILGISLFLSLGVNLVNKKVVDWEKVNAAKARMQEWQEEFREAQRKGNKKKIQKLKLRQSDLMEEQKEVMGATMKPMIFYIVPFILLWWGLNTIYGGWVVAWIPFKFPWPDLGLRIFSGWFVSLGFIGWYLLSYFGFAQIWRKFLIPS